MFDAEALAGRVALVTGASRGLGAEIALTLGMQGAAVAVAARDGTELNALADRVISQTGATVRSYACDLTVPSVAECLVAEVERDLEPVGVLIHCVGGYAHVQSTLRTTPQEWDALISRNLTAAFLAIRTVLPGMIERQWGRIVAIGSEAGRTPAVLSSPGYAAAKAGLAGLCKHIAKETARQGITVNVINPGAMRTDRWVALWRDNVGGLEAMVDTIPTGRTTDLREIAGLVAYLVGPYGGQATGATFDINGGRVMD